MSAAPVDLQHDLSVGFARRYIHRKARQLVGKAGFVTSDRADIEQDLAMKLIQSATKYDPLRAHWNAFVVTVIERHVATLLQARRSQKRAQPPVEFLGAIEWDPIDHIQSMDLQLDTSTIVAALPAESRVLCFHLQHGTTAEAARRLRSSRATLYRRLQGLRKTFERAGF